MFIEKFGGFILVTLELISVGGGVVLHNCVRRFVPHCFVNLEALNQKKIFFPKSRSQIQSFKPKFPNLPPVFSTSRLGAETNKSFTAKPRSRFLNLTPKPGILPPASDSRNPKSSTRIKTDFPRFQFSKSLRSHNRNPIGRGSPPRGARRERTIATPLHRKRLPKQPRANSELAALRRTARARDRKR